MSTVFNFRTKTLINHKHGLAAQKILAAAVNSVNPEAAVRRHLQFQANTVHIENLKFRLQDIERIVLIGVGKAAVPMAKATVEIVGKHVSKGIVITKYGHSAGGNLPSGIAIFEAGHPIPDQAGVDAANQMFRLLKDLNERDLVICLVSGGGSSLLVAPGEGTNLKELKKVNAALLASGADIHEINTVRKHLSAVKGGQLAQFLHPAQVVTMILSDVIGDSLEAIASGPTVPDLGSFADAIGIMEKYGLEVPKRLIDGEAGVYSETPKAGNPIFERMHYVLVGTNSVSAAAAHREAKRLGYASQILTTSLTGEAQNAGIWFAKHLTDMPPYSVWIAGGETTVTLGDEPGFGGRNQEAALAAAAVIAGKDDALMLTLATDGGDGPTDAAGAVISSETLQNAKSLGLNPNDFLQKHNSYHFFEALGDLIKTGPTQTNVNDLWLLIR